DPGNLSGLPEAVRITLMLDANPPRLRGEARKSLAAGTGQAVDNSSTVNTNEPPLVFQTVARLNLAAAARKGGSAGDAQDSGAQPSTQNNATPFFQ
ncbi:MAG TPA: hypothetical protein VHH73_20905, partial [Verrucomicrobiae bacterium]|nr:hypothetical protein [Verrucomicrobiae bacterium]